MLAYWFRLMDGNGQQPTGYVGLAVAPNMRDMFWEIDQYCDPYQVQLKTVRNGSVCTLEPEDDDAERSEWEASGWFPMSSDLGWRVPRWPDPSYGIGR